MPASWKTRLTDIPYRALLVAGLITALITVPLALVIAPPDAIQGEAQRWMYLHVPAAWTAYLCFGLVLAASIWHLVTRRDRSRRVGQVAAYIGVAMTALTLATGSIWGYFTWGTWWAWDARVITTTAMGLIYVVYLIASSLSKTTRAQRWTDVVGIVGFATVPLVHFSVLWWRTLHQPPTILAPSLDPPIEALMGLALASAVLAFTLLAAWVLLVSVNAPQRRTRHDRHDRHGNTAPAARERDSAAQPMVTP